MTSNTDRKVITAKGSLAVVARHATLSAPRRMMIERFGRGHLSALWHSRSYLMAFGARHFLMLGVTETYFETRGKLWRPRIASEFMTRPTRRDVSTICLRARR